MPNMQRYALPIRNILPIMPKILQNMHIPIYMYTMYGKYVNLTKQRMATF